MQRRLQDPHHRHGLTGSGLMPHGLRHRPHRSAAQLVAQGPERQQHQRHEGHQGQLEQQQRQGPGPAAPAPAQGGGQQITGTGQGQPSAGQDSGGQGGQLGVLDQRNPEGAGQVGQTEQGAERQAEAPGAFERAISGATGRRTARPRTAGPRTPEPPAPRLPGPDLRGRCSSSTASGQQNQQTRRRRGRQPVARQLGGGDGEKREHGQQPAGREPMEGNRRGHGAQGPGTQGPPQPQQQQGGNGQAGHHEDRPKEPPGLEVVVHHRGKALEVVVAEEAVPEGAPLPQQGQSIPGQGQQGRQGNPRQGPEPAPQGGRVRLQRGEEQQGEGHQHQGHGPLGENR